MKQYIRIILLITSFLILVIYIIIDRFIEDQCFTNNISIAKRLQANSSKQSDNFYNFWSFWGYGPQQSGILLIYYEFSRKKTKALTLILLMLFLNYLLNVLKIIYAAPRPYMINDEVKAIRCSKGFGNPSGHAMGCIVLFFILANNLRILLFVKNERYTSPSVDENSNSINHNPKNHDYAEQGSKASEHPEGDNSSGALNKIKATSQSQPTGKSKFNTPTSNCSNCWDKWKTFLSKHKLLSYILQALVMGLSLAFIAIIGISRIYLGSHTLCQVILGWFYGGFLLVLYYTILKYKVPEWIGSFSKKNNKPGISLPALFLWFFLYTAVILLIWFLYYFKGRYDENISSWIDNIIRKCGEDIVDEIKLNDKTFFDSGVIGIDFGILLGIIVTKGDYNEEQFRVQYLNLGILRIIGRMLTFAALLVPIYLIFTYVPWGENIYIQFFIKAHLQYFLIGFLLVAVPPTIYQRLGFSVEGDFLKVPKRRGEKQYENVPNQIPN